MKSLELRKSCSCFVGGGVMFVVANNSLLSKLLSSSLVTVLLLSVCTVMFVAEVGGGLWIKKSTISIVDCFVLLTCLFSFSLLLSSLGLCD